MLLSVKGFGRLEWRKGGEKRWKGMFSHAATYHGNDSSLFTYFLRSRPFPTDTQIVPRQEDIVTWDFCQFRGSPPGRRSETIPRNKIFKKYLTQEIQVCMDMSLKCLRVCAVYIHVSYMFMDAGKVNRDVLDVFPTNEHKK